MKHTTIEKIINDKLEAISYNPSLKSSMILHLDAYVQILDFVDSDDEKLKSKIVQMIDESYKEHIKTIH